MTPRTALRSTVAASLRAMEEAFSSLFEPPCARCTGAGTLLELGISPGRLDQSILDEEEGMLSVEALRALGWPL